MKAGRLIEVLKKVSPDAEVRCGIGNVPTLMITNLLNLKRIPKYEVKSVLTKPDDGKYYGDKGVVCSRWELEK